VQAVGDWQMSAGGASSRRSGCLNIDARAMEQRADVVADFTLMHSVAFLTMW